MNLLINPLKIIKIGINGLTSVKYLSLFIIKTLGFSKDNRQLTLKFLSSKLNIRPYDRLDKEVIDFKECKEELITPYNTKCFYY